MRVRISGVDKDGHPFSQDVETFNISRSGARIRWITCLRPGQTVTLQYGRQRTVYKVAWVGLPGSPDEGEVGLRCMEKKYIWDLVLPEDTRDEFDVGAVSAAPTPPLTTAPWSEEERRQNPRYACAGVVDLVQMDTEVHMRGRLSDISQGGCYVDTLAPLPVGARVRASLELMGRRIEAEAVVRTSHPSVGMGLEFTRFDEKNRALFEKLLAQLSGGRR